jgi:preprotein translocase SecE subunit
MSDAPDKLDYARKGESTGGFFTIYRPTQGGWTRLGTAVASALFIGATGWVLAKDVGGTFGWQRTTTVIVVSIFCIGSAILLWWLQNRPRNATFLIETHSEMQKVNWTTRKELIGSTKVVILFMVTMSLLLFVIDMIFHTFFHAVGVLKFGPFGD